MTDSRDQRRNRPSPRKTRSDSESRFTRHFDNGKTRPAKPPDVPTNPDRSCTYLVLRAHRMRHPTSKTRPRVSTRWPRSLLSSDQHLEKHWPGGVKIKMTLGLAKTQGKRLRWQMVKPRLGLAGGVLFKANCQGGPINHPTA